MTVVSVVDPAQEGTEAMDPTRWSMTGVPWMTLFEPVSGNLTPRFTSTQFPTCPECDHAAVGGVSVPIEWLRVLGDVDVQARSDWGAFLQDAEGGDTATWMGEGGAFEPLFEVSDMEGLATAVLGGPD